MRFVGSSFKAEFEQSFGSVDELSVRQMWCLVKIIKHCRLRCRSNAALLFFFRGRYEYVSWFDSAADVKTRIRGAVLVGLGHFILHAPAWALP